MSTSYKHQKNTKNYLVIVLSNQYWYKSFKKKSIKIIKVQLKVFKSFHAVSNMDVYLTQIQHDTATI